MYSTLPPLCHACRHLNPEKVLSCAAFPDGIPGDILSGKINHVMPVSGDRGTRFERASAGPVYFMTTEDSVMCLFQVAFDGACERYVPILDEWEPDNEFVKILLEKGIGFRQIDEFDAVSFIEEAQLQKNAINPCTLQFRQMKYLHSRKQGP